MNSYITFAIVTVVAAMLVASAAAAIEDALAGKKKMKERNQALSQTNTCGTANYH